MGVREPGGSWELQWHPAGGGRVRRILLSRRRRRRLASLLIPVLLVILGLLAALPFGARTLVQRVQIDSLAKENAELHDEETELALRAGDAAERVLAAQGRGRRLAWALGLPREVWGTGGPSVPGPDASTEVVVGWLVTGAAAIERLADALATITPAPPCPIEALPTGAPVDPDRAVVVARFGWRISPFTSPQEAHHGITVAAPLGEPVRAPGAGRVVFAGIVRERRSNEWTRLGTTVVVDHGGGVSSVLGGLAAATVRRGDRVVRGAVVGSVGQTAWTRVPAVYFEIRWPVGGVSQPIDPGLVSSRFDVADLDAALNDPTGSLPEDFARLERLPGGGR